MTNYRKQKLIAKLKENDSKEIPFYKTKTELLNQGYSETEINHAVYESSYDGKKNYTKPEDPVTRAFKTNPALAEEIASQILDDAKRHERTKTLAAGAASRFAPGRHAQAKFEFEFFERLGLPYFKIFFSVILLYILIEILDLPMWIMTVCSLIIGLWIAQAFYSRFLKK